MSPPSLRRVSTPPVLRGALRMRRDRNVVQSPCQAATWPLWSLPSRHRRPLVEFDQGMLAAARRRHGLPPLGVARWSCAMEQYAAWYGDYSDVFGDYKYQRLPGGDHSAAGDCRAV